MKTRDVIARQFPRFGRNKVQELERLAAEIARRDAVSVSEVLAAIPRGCTSFAAVKDALAARRFSELALQGIKVRESFSALAIDPADRQDVTRPREFYPKELVIEEKAADSALAGRVRRRFPKALERVVPAVKDLRTPGMSRARAYNQRLDRLTLVHEQFDFFKRCPCSPGVTGCGYYNVNLGFGCPFECTYCFLQSYANAPGIVLPANIEDFFAVFRAHPVPGRMGSGETADSLAFDPLTGFAPRLVDFFRGYPHTFFFYMKKSDRIDGLLSVKAAANVVAAWSVNPPSVIAREEFFTAPLARRLDAAARSAAHGYKTAFHFDPVFYFPGWEEEYLSVIREIFRAVPASSVAWISLGTLRMTPYQKKMIENRFPETTILLSELLTAPDGKIRYHESVREKIYRYLSAWLQKIGPGTPFYLCMEPGEMWQRLGWAGGIR